MPHGGPVSREGGGEDGTVTAVAGDSFRLGWVWVGGGVWSLWWDVGKGGSEGGGAVGGGAPGAVD